MMEITARVFDNGKLIGYQVTDGIQIQMINKQQAWSYAKNKQINNVLATGDENNPSLSGTNGFELKRLPEIEWNKHQSVNKNTENKFNYTREDILAAAIRNVVKTKKIPNIHLYYYLEHDMEYYKQCLEEDIKSGILTEQNCRTLSNSIYIINKLYYTEYENSRKCEGYRIENIGNQPIVITRITAKTHNMSYTVLNPNKKICLNKQELTLLASKPEVGCTFVNGKLTELMAGTTGLNMRKFLIMHEVIFNSDNEVEDEIMANLLKIERPDIISLYFKNIEEIKDTNKYLDNMK